MRLTSAVVRLCFWSFNRDGVACSRLLLRLRIFCCDILDLPRDRDRLECIGTRKLFQKLLDLCGFVVSDNHINLSLTLSRRRRVGLWKLSPPVSRPSM